MHPSKFFDECYIDDMSLYVSERDELLEKLKNVHPRNWLASCVNLYVVVVDLEYRTGNNNLKQSKKYILMPLDIDSVDDAEYQAEIMCESYIEMYNMKHIDAQLRDYRVIGVEIVTRVALPIG